MIYNSTGMTNEGVYMAFVDAGGEISTAHAGDSEEITVFLMTKDEIKSLTSDPSNMIGAKAYLVFDRFVTHGDL